jgi:hypothetical protein
MSEKLKITKKEGNQILYALTAVELLMIVLVADTSMRYYTSSNV